MNHLQNTILFLGLLFLSFFSLAQSPQGIYGNEWYSSDPSRTFIPLKVWEDGLYRVSAQDLLAMGYDLSTVNPAHLQLFYRGAEQRIYVQRSGNTLDYLEFEGLRNDGQLDALMYRDPITGQPDPSLQPQPWLSLYTDTSTYYLTWSNQPGLRMSSFFDDDYASYSPTPSFPARFYREFRPGENATDYLNGGGGQFDSFYFLNPDYVTGEGYVGPHFALNDPMALSVDLPAALPDTQTLAFHAQIFGRSNTPHFLRIWVNQTIAFDTTVQFSQVSLREHPFSFFAASPNAPLNLQFEALRSPVDNNHLTGLSIVYRRLPDLLGEKQTVLDHWPQSETIRLDLTQIDGIDSLYVWDTQLGIRSKGLITSSQGQVLVPLSPASQNVRIVSDLGVQTPLIQAAARLNNLCAPDSGAQFVIISHRSLAASAEAYAHYRDTSGIEPLSSRVVYVDEIYEEFGYGSITPLAIKRFVNCALSNWNTPPEYLLMWGNGSYLIRENPWIKVPYYGYPANDLEYTRDLSSTTIVESLVSVGRLNINNNAEGFAYLNKLDRFEHRPLDNWQQRGIFLGAGATIGEIDAIESGLTYVRQQFVSPPMNGSSIYFGYDGQPQVPTPVLDSNFFQWMDQGVGLMHYFGHSTNQLWQIEVGEPEDYQNVDRPLALFAYGCNSSSFVDTNKVLLERWIASPDRGAIACVGITGAGYLNPLRDFQRIFADGYYPIDPSQRIGDVMRHSINLYTDSLDGVQYRNHARYLLLQGDPAVRIFAPAYAPADSVWPGDVNDDGVANMDDLLRIGLAYGDSGYARVNPTINWQAQAAIAWSQSFADGVNHKHADCDGDGLVVASDTLAISQNYGLIHQKTEENNFTAAGIPLTLYFPQSVNPGDTATVEVWAGDSLNPVSLYGLRFELSYDTAQVSTDQIWVDMSDSWLGTPGQNLLSMYKVLPNEAQIHQGITRIDHQALLGGGKVSDINIVITDDIAKQPWNLQSIVLKNGQAFDEVGNDIPLNALAAWNNELPPITPLYTRIFPNPAAEQICIERTDHQVKDFHLLDMRGRVCANWTEKEVEIGCLSLEGVHAGLYLLVFEEDELRRTLKIVIEES